MPKSQIALKPDIIFALDKNKPFADTSIETWSNILSLIRDIEPYVQQRGLHDDPPKGNGEELFCKYPFLEYVHEEARPGNPYWEFRARVRVWSCALNALGYNQFNKEYKDLSWLWDFENQFSRGDYTLLWNPLWLRDFEGKLERNVQDFIWSRNDYMTRQELLLHRYAYGELWAFTQRLKLQDLTPAQEQDRQKLELFTASNIKATLVAHEMEPVYKSRMGVQLEGFDKDKAAATRIVEKRIAKGDWQLPGPYKFKFNGIKTDIL